MLFQNLPVSDPWCQRAAGLALVLLGAWVGSLLLLGSVVAPAAFAVAPTSAEAGNLVGRVLAVLDWAGVIAGLILAGISASLARGAWSLSLALLMSLACLLSRLLLAPAIAALRPFLQDPAVRARFGLLHGVSVGVFGAVTLAGLALIVLHLHAREPKKTG